MCLNMSYCYIINIKYVLFSNSHMDTENYDEAVRDYEKITKLDGSAGIIILSKYVGLTRVEFVFLWIHLGNKNLQCFIIVISAITKQGQIL